MAEFPAMPLWTDAYLGDTTHLTTIEHGAYLLLLIAAWRSRTHDLPDDDNQLAKYCHLTPAQWNRVKKAVLPFFKRLDGRLSNGRLLDEVEAVRRLQNQRLMAGRSSALKRLHRQSTGVERNVNGGQAPIPIPIPTLKRDGLQEPENEDQRLKRIYSECLSSFGPYDPRTEAAKEAIRDYHPPASPA